MSRETVVLNALHKKEQFGCGKPFLDNYLHKQAKQDVKKRLSGCFVLADTSNKVEGYYTLSSASIKRSMLPEVIIKKLPPSYQDLPATLLGRLAIDLSCKGKGLGEFLLLDALKRCYNSSLKIGSMAVVVDPLDEDAIHFYKKYGFIQLPDSGKMFLAMETLAGLFPAS
jgi:predicted GNAT family N-acyltransferase